MTVFTHFQEMSVKHCEEMSAKLNNHSLSVFCVKIDKFWGRGAFPQGSRDIWCVGVPHKDYFSFPHQKILRVHVLKVET